jgi:hypothetical protein
VAKLTNGTWNVRTLLDNAHADRGTVLTANELTRYNIDIAALQETRYSSLKEGQAILSGVVVKRTNAVRL